MVSRFLHLQAETPSDKVAQLLLRAHVATFVDGLKHGHINSDCARKFWKGLHTNIAIATGSDTSRSQSLDIPAHAAWTMFGKTAREVGEDFNPTTGKQRKFGDLRNPSAQYDAQHFVSLVPLHLHCDLIHEGATKLKKPSHLDVTKDAIEVGDHSFLENCVKCLRKAITDEYLASSRTLTGGLSKSTDVTATHWMVPFEGRVEELVLKFVEATIPQRAVSALRNLTGRWDGGDAGPPLAAFVISNQRQISAPNVLTAAGYERFRHRPKMVGEEMPPSGLTYNLDREDAVRRPGVAELVTPTILMSDVNHIYSCGRPKQTQMSPDEKLQSHCIYSDVAADNRSMGELIDELETLI